MYQLQPQHRNHWVRVANGKWIIGSKQLRLEQHTAYFSGCVSPPGGSWSREQATKRARRDRGTGGRMCLVRRPWTAAGAAVASGERGSRGEVSEVDQSTSVVRNHSELANPTVMPRWKSNGLGSG